MAFLFALAESCLGVFGPTFEPLAHIFGLSALQNESKTVQTHQKYSHDTVDILITPISPPLHELLLIELFHFLCINYMCVFFLEL